MNTNDVMIGISEWRLHAEQTVHGYSEYTAGVTSHTHYTYHLHLGLVKRLWND